MYGREFFAVGLDLGMVMFSWFRKKRDLDLLDPNAVTKCVQAGKLDEALKRIDAILRAAPDVAMSHRYRGEILFGLNRFAESEASFLEAERLGGPGTEESFFWRALAAANAGDSARGVDILTKYIDSPDANPELRQKCANAVNAIAGQ